MKYQLSALNQEKYFLLSASLPPEQRDGLVTLLLKYVDVFAWNPYEAPGVDPVLPAAILMWTHCPGPSFRRDDGSPHSIRKRYARK